MSYLQDANHSLTSYGQQANNTYGLNNLAMAGAQGLSDAPCVASRLQSSLQDIQGLAESAAKIRARLRDMGDRALGSEPEGKQAGAHPRPVPMGTADAIAQATNDVGQILGECHDLLTRLERLV